MEKKEESIGKFACLRCAADRPSASSDCPSCGWSHTPSRGRKQTNAACPLCQSDVFTWDQLKLFGGLRLSVLDHRSVVFQGSPIQARRCESCGNIQLFSDL